LNLFESEVACKIAIFCKVILFLYIWALKRWFMVTSCKWKVLSTVAFAFKISFLSSKESLFKVKVPNEIAIKIKNILQSTIRLYLNLLSYNLLSLNKISLNWLINLEILYPICELEEAILLLFYFLINWC
jgi:hypothetical protein